MERFYEEFGRLLRHQRQRSGFKQGVLGRAVGLSRTSITNIERGRQRLPLHLFAEIVRVLEVEPAELLPQPAAKDVALRPKFQKVLADLDASAAEREAVRRIDSRIERGSKREGA